MWLRLRISAGFGSVYPLASAPYIRWLRLRSATGFRFGFGSVYPLASTPLSHRFPFSHGFPFSHRYYHNGFLFSVNACIPSCASAETLNSASILAISLLVPSGKRNPDN